MSKRRLLSLIALVAVVGATLSVLALPRPLSYRVIVLRCSSSREANEAAGRWFESGELDRDVTMQVGEALLRDNDRGMRRKCVNVLRLAQVQYAQECDSIARQVLLDDDADIVAACVPLLRRPLTRADLHLLLGIWRSDSVTLQSSIVIAIGWSPERVKWYARLLQAHDVTSPLVRDDLWEGLHSAGCPVPYSMDGPDEKGQWEGVLEWLKERTPGEW